MKDTYDVVTDVRSLVNVPAVTSLLGSNGDIHSDEKPDGRSEFIDVVINCLGINNYQMQKGSGNINIYVPPIKVGNKQSADRDTFKKIGNVIVGLVDAKYKLTFQTWIEDTPKIKQDTDGTYYMNIPFEYQSYNKEFTNI